MAFPLARLSVTTATTAMLVAMFSLSASIVSSGFADASDASDLSGRGEQRAAETTWEGRWMNRKYNTNGPLRCEATRKGEGQITATFSGLYKGDPFKYQVEFQSKTTGNGASLSGKATLDGDRYQWTGAVQGNTMTGAFRSLKGNNGMFTLKRVKAPSDR